MIVWHPASFGVTDGQRMSCITRSNVSDMLFLLQYSENNIGETRVQFRNFAATQFLPPLWGKVRMGGNGTKSPPTPLPLPHQGGGDYHSQIVKCLPILFF